LDLSLRLLPGHERPRAASAWRTVERAMPHVPLTCSWPWTATWLDHYGDLVPHRFAVAESGDGPVAAALLTSSTRRKGPFRLRSVHVGTAGEPQGDSVFVEYNGLLAARGSREEFARALLDGVREQLAPDEISLDGFDSQDAELFRRWEPSLHARREPCRAFDLRTARVAGSHCADILRAGPRRRLRRSIREVGEVRTDWGATPERAAEILEELIELHQLRWTGAGQPGAFASRRFVSFHRALVARLVPLDRALLFRARAGGRTLGCVYCLIDGRRAMSYQSGAPRLGDNKLRPGMVTEALCMQHCLERGLDEYSFLAGDSRYKQEMSNVERALVWASARTQAPKWRLIEAARAVREPPP
jgi:CelD/BcsL family acetyltransferase involved in cellulose biosynthesis